MGKTVRAVSHVEHDHAADSNIEAAVNAALAKKEDMFEKLLQMKQSTFQACLQSFVEATNKRFDNLVRNNAKEIAELRASVQFTQKETDDMKQAMRSQSEQVRANIRGIDAAAAAQREIEDGIDYIENQTRRNNLRIDGVILRAQLRRGPTPRQPYERPSRLHSSCPNGTRTTSGSSARTERAATTTRISLRPWS